MLLIELRRGADPFRPRQPQPPRRVLGAVRGVGLAAAERHALRCDLPRPAVVAASGPADSAAPAAVDHPHAVAPAHERAARLDRHEPDRHVAGGAAPRDGLPGAAHAGRRPLQQLARAAPLSGLSAAGRRAPEVLGGRGRAAGGVCRLGLGPLSPRAPRSIPRVVGRRAAAQPAAARLQHPLPDSAVGAGAAPGRPARWPRRAASRGRPDGSEPADSAAAWGRWRRAPAGASTAGSACGSPAGRAPGGRPASAATRRTDTRYRSRRARASARGPRHAAPGAGSSTTIAAGPARYIDGRRSRWDPSGRPRRVGQRSTSSCFFFSQSRSTFSRPISS